jgi:hypothetical protein
VAKIEDKKLLESKHEPLIENAESAELHQEQAIVDNSHHIEYHNESSPAIYEKTQTPTRVMKEYQVNTKNLERFLDVPPTDDNYYQNINK